MTRSMHKTEDYQQVKHRSDGAQFLTVFNGATLKLDRFEAAASTDKWPTASDV